jgi:molybdate transport system substrate-binding protein
VFLYAIGRLVVWVPASSPLQPQEVGGAVLLDPGVRRIAVANPAHAPYGVAAVAALRSLKLYDAVEPKLVYGENIAQTAQYVQSGAADIGVIALSLALAPTLRDKGRWWAVPLDAYPTMWQGGIVLRRTQLPERARAFCDFVLGPHGREVLGRYGFSLP